LFVGSSRHNLVLLERGIRRLALLVGGAALALGILLSWWAAVRVTRPVAKLVEGAREVAGGNWDARVQIDSHDEMGALAGAFNQMTGQLAEQRERLVQTERVAAWRELARRLAHELKNPLFPLQITVENLRRAREQNAADFDEIFRESTETLLAEIQNLKTIVGRFSDFAKMPRPELQPVNVNEMVRGVTRLFEPRFIAPGEPEITTELHLDEKLPLIQADSTLLHRAIGNLVLNAIDAMPKGGKLTLRTMAHDGEVRLEISDTGMGLTPEECERLFTPYYTTKQHGTGLGLAIVQSVVSDHGGRISVASEQGHGTTFRIDLPEHPPASVSSLDVDKPAQSTAEREA
jgi:nitrogen fixation/metabolism regulation signal transduction histidine kinase